MYANNQSRMSFLFAGMLGVLVLTLTGCPSQTPAPAKKSNVTIALSADETPFVDVALNIQIGEKAQVIHVDELESLMVTVSEIQLTRLLDGGGTETITVFNTPIDLDLLNLVGVFEVLDESAIPSGTYVEATLVLANASLVLASDPGVLIEDVILLDGGSLTVGVSFEAMPDDDGILILDLGGISLTQLDDGSFQLVPDLLVDLIETHVTAQAIGKIASIYDEYLTLVKGDSSLEVKFSDAIVFLPEDFDMPTGSHDDLEVGQKIFVFGQLGIDGILDAQVIVIFPGERPDDGPNVRLKFWLCGTDLAPEAIGKVEYKAEHGRRWLKANVEHVFGTPEAAIVVDGILIGYFDLHEGNGHFALDTHEGDEVPELFEDSIIEIQHPDTGDVLLRSRLHTPGHDDDDKSGDHDGDDDDGHPCARRDDDDDDDEEEVKFRLNLHGTEAAPHAEGALDYYMNDEEELVEMEVKRLGDVEEVHVRIDGDVVATVPVEEGKAKLRRKSTEGHEVPAVQEDSLVEIVHPETGDVLATSEEGEEIKFRLELHGTDAAPDAEGVLDYVAQHGWRLIEMEVEHLDDYEEVDIVIDGVVVATKEVDDDEVKLRLKTSEGDLVPMMTEDSVVEIVVAGTDLLLATT